MHLLLKEYWELYNKIVTFVLKSKELLRIVESQGWKVCRIKGSHYLLKHSNRKGILIIPNHGSKTIGKGLVRKILKQAGAAWKK